MKSGHTPLRDSSLPNALRAQILGAMHTLMSHAVSCVVVHAIHSRAPVVIGAEEMRRGLIYEVLDGIGPGLAALTEAVMADRPPSHEELDGIDPEVSRELADAVALAMYMICCGREAEYRDCMHHPIVLVACPRRLLALCRDGAHMLSAAEDAGDDDESGSSEEEEEDDQEECECRLCKAWATLDERFAAWTPECALGQAIARSIAAISAAGGSR